MNIHLNKYKNVNSLWEHLAQRKDGFEVSTIQLLDGGYVVSITKGNLFKAVLGMKTALKINLTPQQGKIYFEASVGIYGQQAIPTIISMFFFWPVLITQIWGMIEQSRLDDKALEIAEKYVAEHAMDEQLSSSAPKKFCTNCGHKLEEATSTCPKCGSKI